MKSILRKIMSHHWLRRRTPGNSEVTSSSLAHIAAWCLRCLPPEMAHNIGLQLLSHRAFHRYLPGMPPSIRDLSVPFPWGNSDPQHRLPHPIGLAAGYDKNGRAVQGLTRLGFSFIEVGTITPRPQWGHPQPRVFRLRHRAELINRMGFPNLGMNTAAAYLGLRSDLGCLVGINIGKNLITRPQDAIEDYLAALRALKECGHYFVINVSSPNTEGLRDLAQPVFFEHLKERLCAMEPGILSQTWIKLDPDSQRRDFQKNIESILACSFAGVILCNTHAVAHPHKGGLSGHSLRCLAVERLIWAREVHEGHLAMISVGGISTGSDVLHALSLGACAVQIYTALTYRGPWAVIQMLQELEEEMSLRGMRSLSELPHLR